MGSTESGTADFSVGSIVWVRRRNGSWWPGKIVGPEELSASHLTSPRSGTPVKLLGREDASVDWYNLEKSKRVKAFRCGEFDDCIERAESSQGMPIKKREKYARREDAILHALELEKQLMKKQGKLGIASDRVNSKSYGAVKRGLVTASESLGNDNVKLGNSKQTQFAKRVDVSHKNESLDSPLLSQKSKEGNQLSGEEDHSEAIPRMRGLQDFGLRIAPSKRRLSSSVASNGSRKPTVETSAQALYDGLEMGSASPVNGAEQMGVICRAKRSRCVYLPAESSESLDYKAITQNDIDLTSSQMGVNLHPDSLIEDAISGSTEDESDTSETDSSDESDSSDTERDMADEMAVLSDAAVPTDPEMSSFGRYEAQELGSMGSDEPDESVLSGDISHPYNQDLVSANEAVSKWQLKGKRNTRNLTKRPVDGYLEEKASPFIFKDFRTEIVGLENGYSTSRSGFSGRSSIGCNMMDWDDWRWDDQLALKGYWDMNRDRFDPLYDGRRGGRSRSMLIDVDLKVQASYQKEPVPIVSLMSKLNGKAIIGHPIQIEALEDGSSGDLLPTIDDFGNDGIDNDGNTALPQAWRTARRTANVRVPRPHLSSSALDGDEAAYGLPFLDRESKPPFKRSNLGSSSHKAGLGKRTSPALNNSGASSENSRKFQKKTSSKKVSWSSSQMAQKTRTLSSIAVDKNFSSKSTTHDDSGSSQTKMKMNGLIKPESSGPPTVACIPVKLVFSRLLEKINRPPIKAASSTAALLNSDVERNP
ncbi:uncharacterized protein At1g51745 isoform X2 [Ziziphus jujuba]|uniref:Uncharacterized protein At1g51745 isoform X2 n=1 Tax=Ziziphus jujuba TaxID=326968 RepID=A0A6P3ZGF0_ZIZJJ|nr:uncharacterized protein At1g51745 isoform X2 [Ziziphus jujuba]